jgi:hypothetical protein
VRQFSTGVDTKWGSLKLIKKKKKKENLAFESCDWGTKSVFKKHSSLLIRLYGGKKKHITVILKPAVCFWKHSIWLPATSHFPEMGEQGPFVQEVWHSKSSLNLLSLQSNTDPSRRMGCFSLYWQHFRHRISHSLTTWETAVVTQRTSYGHRAQPQPVPGRNMVSCSLCSWFFLSTSVISAWGIGEESLQFKLIFAFSALTI